MLRTSQFKAFHYGIGKHVPLPSDAQVLAYITEYIRNNGGVPPSYNDMQKALCIASRGALGGIMNRLVASGRLRRLPNRARAIEVIPEPSTGPMPVMNTASAKMFVWDDEAKTLKPMPQKA